MQYRENTTIWAEKYRPRELKDYICSEEFREVISNIIEREDIPNMLLCGSPGIGKTTLAKMVINELKCKDYMQINAADEMQKGGLDRIRDRILPFCNSAPQGKYKIILLEEFHSIPIKNQETLNYIIELYSDNVRFILTCNHSEKILQSIKSRFVSYDIDDTPKEDIMNRIIYILDSENIEYDINDESTLHSIVGIINEKYPDIRSTITSIWSKCINGKYLPSKSEIKRKSEFDDIISIMNSKKKPNDKIKEIRQIITDLRITNFEVLYKYLYTNIDNIQGDLSTNIIILNQYQYQDYYVIDKEINVMSMFCSFLTQE